jgi:CheY-like chemotaxis protein
MDQGAWVQGSDVLVVDDDPAILDLVSEFLEDEGYTIRTACDGLEAWQAIKAAPPRLLVTDIRMPRMPGCELVARVRASGHDFPIVVIAATPALAAPLLRFENTAYVPKPFELEVLLATAQQSLARAVVAVA